MQTELHTEKTHFIFKIFGFMLLILGILGIFLPFVPAFILIPLGLALMGEKRMHKWFRKK